MSKLGTIWAVMDAGDISEIEDIVSEAKPTWLKRDRRSRFALMGFRPATLKSKLRLGSQHPCTDLSEPQFSDLKTHSLILTAITFLSESGISVVPCVRIQSHALSRG